MTRFDESADRLVELVGEGLNLTEACKKAGVPYTTARTWVAAGRREPSGKYGPFLAALDRARRASCLEDDPQSSAVGPVERQIEAMLGGRDFDPDAALAAEQAKVLGHTIDELAKIKGGAAATALVAASRRLEEVVAGLALPKEDSIERMRDEIAARRAAGAHSGQRPSTDRARRSTAPSANGKVDDAGHAIGDDRGSTPLKSREW